MFLVLGGSHAYGTNKPGSDIDIRGAAFNSKSDLLGLSKFDQVVHEQTDTTVFSFRKLVELLCANNPNTIELLGAKPEHYLIYSPVAHELIANQKMFLSKRAIYSFGGYANQQLRRLQNAVARDRVGEAERERHILGSVTQAMHAIKGRYADLGENGLSLGVVDDELVMNVNLNGYPVRDFKNLYSEIADIVGNYDKLNKRNRRPMEKSDAALDKHAMHLVRLYLMVFDILEQGKVVTYRADDLELLNEIRNGKFRLPDGTYDQGFFEYIDELDQRLKYAAAHTELPDNPDMNQVQDFVMSVNERYLTGNVAQSSSIELPKRGL